MLPSAFFLPFQRLFRGQPGVAAGMRHHHHGQVMHDPVDIRRRIDHLVTRVDRRDDYGQLLARGQVIHRLGDVAGVDAWRRDQTPGTCGQDQVRTGVNDGIVWALRLRADRPGGHAEVRAYRDLLRRTVPLAVELRHEPSIMLWDGDEVICACCRCSALGYGDTAEDVVGGALFEDECADEEPPMLTALARR